MPKVKGPLHSVSASGTFHGAIVFNARTLGSVVSKRPLITQPRTPSQEAHNQKIVDLSAAWRTLSPAAKSSWGACGALVSLDGRQLFWREWISQGSTPLNYPVLPC